MYSLPGCSLPGQRCQVGSSKNNSVTHLTLRTRSSPALGSRGGYLVQLSLSGLEELLRNLDLSVVQVVVRHPDLLALLEPEQIFQLDHFAIFMLK